MKKHTCPHCKARLAYVLDSLSENVPVLESSLKVEELALYPDGIKPKFGAHHLVHYPGDCAQPGMFGRGK